MGGLVFEMTNQKHGPLSKAKHPHLKFSWAQLSQNRIM
jgi:hypothetical protein